MKKTLIALAATLPLIACAGAPVIDPNYVAYVQGEVAKATEQTKAETARLLAITAVAQGGDDRVKDRALNELQASRQAVGAPSIAPPAPKPNEALQWAQVILNPLAQVLGITIDRAADVKLAEQQTIQHGITWGTVGGIAQGGYNLGSQGLQSTQALGQAGIAKIPSITVHAAPVVTPFPVPKSSEPAAPVNPIAASE